MAILPSTKSSRSFNRRYSSVVSGSSLSCYSRWLFRLWAASLSFSISSVASTMVTKVCIFYLRSNILGYSFFLARSTIWASFWLSFPGYSPGSLQYNGLLVFPGSLNYTGFLIINGSLNNHGLLKIIGSIQ